MPDMTSEDLARVRAAVQLRDRCVKAAVDRMAYLGELPNAAAARVTYDAVAELIRQDERQRLERAGRLLPEGAKRRLPPHPHGHPPMGGTDDAAWAAAAKECVHCSANFAMIKLLRANGVNPDEVLYSPPPEDHGDYVVVYHLVPDGAGWEPFPKRYPVTVRP